MEFRDFDVETFTAKSKEELDTLINRFYEEHPGAEVQITNHRVGYNESRERHDYAIFYLH